MKKSDENTLSTQKLKSSEGSFLTFIENFYLSSINQIWAFSVRWKGLILFSWQSESFANDCYFCQQGIEDS